MLCKEMIQRLEHTFPRTAALEWDNVGLLLGRQAKEVSCIYLAVDATETIISEAKSCHADMIITHHPLIFSPLKTITDEHFIGSRVVDLLQHDICYYAMHTNYDVLRMAELSADMIGMLNQEVMEETADGKGIGRVGELGRQMSLKECCDLVKERFHLDQVKVFGELETCISRVAISPGSGKGMSSAAIASGAQVFITGDIDHHEGIDAVSQGLMVIDAGHYGLEHIFIEDMKRFLEQEFPDLTVRSAPIRHPFQIR